MSCNSLNDNVYYVYVKKCDKAIKKEFDTLSALG
jgi:hypothetical protein